MNHSFRPFSLEEKLFLTEGLRINFAHTDFTEPHWLCVSGRDDEGRLMGAACFEFKTFFDAHFTILIRDRSFVTRRLLEAVFRGVFSKATRVTALIEPWNVNAVRKAETMGFRVEGYMRNAIEGDRDAVLLGMVREDCRYLRERPSDGKHTKGTRPVQDGVGAAERRGWRV